MPPTTLLITTSVAAALLCQPPAAYGNRESEQSTTRTNERTGRLTTWETCLKSPDDCSTSSAGLGGSAIITTQTRCKAGGAISGKRRGPLGKYKVPAPEWTAIKISDDP
ncbi:hypothetical protein GGR56DRAFT_167256 [Xylariaceae sp. FL0804]|nr:hypothetical protein GGR56DRAFT_167256 [Xylariaceae sp. FL0804]